MQLRVVGQMESWRGRGRRAGWDAVNWLAAAWKSGPDPGGGPGVAGEVHTDAAGQVNGAGASLADPVPPDAAPPDAAPPHPVLPHPGLPGRPEQALVRTPARPEDTAEHNRVPSWLQTGAAWSWRLLLLAGALYLIARVISI